MGAKMCHAKSQTSGERIDYLPPKKDANRACTFQKKLYLCIAIWEGSSQGVS